MKEQFQRTEMLLGEEAMNKIFQSKVCVFGLGGVGGYVVEALARAGVGSLDLIDHDTVSESNLNRQILATHETIGQFKANVAADRVRSINPDCKVTVYPFFILPQKNIDAMADDSSAYMPIEDFDLSEYDYVVDAIDTITGKLAIIEKAKMQNVPVISCMGTGNKMDPTAFRVADLYETTVCPLAKVMRKECKIRGIESLKVVYSTEPPIKPSNSVIDADAALAKSNPERKKVESVKNGTVPEQQEDEPRKKDVPGSNSFTPAAAGLVLAAAVIKDIITCE